MDSFKLSDRQKAWLRDPATTGEQRKAFIARGPAYVQTLMNFKTDEYSYLAMLRGLAVNETRFADPESALAEARRIQADLAKVACPLDERALGIDDANWTIATLCEEHDLHLDRIVHLGALMMLVDTYDDDLIDDIIEAAEADADLCRQLGLKLSDDAMPREEIGQQLLDHGTFGVLIEVSTPVPTFSLPGSSGYSFSWGHTRHHWVYAANLEEAVREAAAWAENYRKEEKARQLGTATEGTAA
jgi:hypothetical protein